jgi:hypothetical protein
VAALALVAATAYAGEAEPPGNGNSPPPQAPAVGYRAQVIPPGPFAVPDQYIVTLRPGADPAAFANEEQARGNRVDHVYRAALNGYAGALNPAEVAPRLRTSSAPRPTPGVAAGAAGT